MLASIPSPASDHLGPFRAYGVLVALGVLVAVEIGERRWRARGGRPGAIHDVALPIIVAGVVGARLYHVATDYQRFEDDPWRAIQIWKGGLSIWGAVACGAVAAVLVSRRRGLDPLVVLDCLAPGVLVAQAIGRWGNWFNQELFGRPTTLPWALEIDRAHRPDRYLDVATFHPTFLYESLWCLAVAAVLLVVERRWHPRPGRVFALYVALYTFGRFWFENLRVDPAHRLGPLRINAWVSLLVFAGAVVSFVWLGRREREAVAT